MGKIEGLVNTPKPPKRNKFRCTVRYYTDRSKAMADILKYDNDAEFKVCGDSTFKVRTVLSLNDLNRIMIYNDRMTNVRNAWFF
jgi:hypothetical protein